MGQRFGTALATRAGAHARIKGAEGGKCASGRTFNLLRELPDGSLFVVAHQGMVRHCEGCLRAQDRSASAVTIVEAHQRLHEQIIGLRKGTVAIDHDVFRLRPVLARELQQVIDLLR